METSGIVLQSYSENSGQDYHTIVHSKMAVTADFSSKQLLQVGFAQHHKYRLMMTN